MTDPVIADPVIADDAVVNGLTGLEWRALCGYVRHVADQLELRDWTIVVETDPPLSEDAGAAIRPVYGRKRAWLRFRDDFRRAGADDQVQTVAHELLHCHLDAIETPLEDDSVADLMGSAAYHVLFQAHRNAIEFAVDAIAESFVHHLPTIDWGFLSPGMAAPSPAPWALGPWRPDPTIANEPRSAPLDASGVET